MYNASKLILLSTLLSKGEPVTKANVYFQLYDSKGTQMLTREQIQLMLSHIYEIVFEYLPLFYRCCAEFHSNMVDVTKIVNLMRFWKFLQPEAVRILTERLCPLSEVSSIDFVQRVANNEGIAITSTTNMRDFVHEVAKASNQKSMNNNSLGA